MCATALPWLTTADDRDFNAVVDSTLPVLVEIVGASVANGTNRVAILMENAVAAVSFHGGKKVPWRFVAPLLLPIIVGAGAGAWVATLLSAETMKRVFGVVIVLVALSMLIRPSRWMQEGEPRIREPWRSLAFLGIGFYGGFVQAGVGFLLLVGLVSARVNLFEADFFGNHCVVAVSSFSGGWLIQATVGSAGGSGGLRTKRSGWAV